MDEMAVVLIAVVIVQKIIERVREYTPKLDGMWVSLASVVLGMGFAFAAGFDVLHEITMYEWPWWLDRIVTGIGIGSGAGFFADLAGRSGPRAEAAAVAAPHEGCCK